MNTRRKAIKAGLAGIAGLMTGAGLAKADESKDTISKKEFRGFFRIKDTDEPCRLMVAVSVSPERIKELAANQGLGVEEYLDKSNKAIFQDEEYENVMDALNDLFDRGMGLPKFVPYIIAT